MSRLNVKYEPARDDIEPSDYFLQSTQQNQSAPEKEIPIWKKAFQVVTLIFLYFVLSIGLTFYQPWLYHTYGFHFPLGVSICHFVVKFLLSAFIRCIKSCCKGEQLVKVPWKIVIRALAPSGIASGLDVGLSNWALSIITVSLYTMTKSTTIIFILGFALIFKLERKSWSLIGTVLMISLGLLMFTYKSTQFHILGFVLCLLASFSSGLRWTMVQIIMQKSKLGLRNPVDMMYYMQPWMLLPVIPITLWFEGSEIYDHLSNTNWLDVRALLSTFFAVIASAILAFNMEVMEFLVVTHTSSLTLSISGILKEICTLIIAFVWNGDQMSSLNFIGLLMCLGGITLHVVQKVLSEKNKTVEHLEMRSNSFTNDNANNDGGVDTTMPLLTQKSTSLTNLLNSSFSSDEEEVYRAEDIESSDILSKILQRREQT